MENYKAPAASVSSSDYPLPFLNVLDTLGVSAKKTDSWSEQYEEKDSR